MAFKLPYQYLSLNNIIIVWHWFPYILISPQFRLEANLQHFERNFWKKGPDFSGHTWVILRKITSVILHCVVLQSATTFLWMYQKHIDSRFCKLCLALKKGMRQNKYSLIPTVMWWILNSNSTSQNKFMVCSESAASLLVCIAFWEAMQLLITNTSMKALHQKQAVLHPIKCQDIWHQLCWLSSQW